jgi:catechol 2,3-dioxygenase-like lactoylglutathione lyase family enzyme
MNLRVLSTVALLVAFAASPRTSSETLPFDHVQFGVPEPAKAVAWYRARFGGAPTPEGQDRLMFGETRFVFQRTAHPQPSAGGAIDHIGFSVADLDATMKTLKAAHVRILTPAHDVAGLFKIAFVEDPWGVKIEVVQDAALLGFHHVHLSASDPDAALAWCSDMFGGNREMLKGRVDGLSFGTMWVLADKGAPAPSAGRALDHIGWRTTDMAPKAAELTEKGATFTTQPAPATLNGKTLQIAFIESPWKAKIEVVQR